MFIFQNVSLQTSSGCGKCAKSKTFFMPPFRFALVYLSICPDVHLSENFVTKVEKWSHLSYGHIFSLILLIQDCTEFCALL